MSDTIQALQTFLAEERPVEEEMVPAELDGSYREKLVQPPSTCVVGGCDNEVRVLEEDGQFLVRCYANSEHVEYVDKNDRQRYRPDFEAVLNDVAANLSLTPVDYTGDALPRYALGQRKTSTLRYCTDRMTTRRRSRTCCNGQSRMANLVYY